MANQAESLIYSYLTELFRDQEGLVYCPTKGASASSWVRHFFAWPAQCDDIINHMIEANKVKKDVYIAPSLFKSNRDATKDNWHGTRYVWVDFDGNAPQTDADIPHGIPGPTIRIQTSIQGREHWYWKLDDFYTGKSNRKIIEGITRGLAYAFDADKSGADAVQVLRAPGTRHRVKGITASVRFAEANRVYSLEDFSGLIAAAPPDDVHIKTLENQLPSLTQVLVDVQLNDIAREIFFRTKEEIDGVRSDSLFRFCMECLESGVKNIEILTMLNDMSYRWGKFEERSDRFTRIKQVLQNALIKHDKARVDEDDTGNKYADFKFITLREAFDKQTEPINWYLTNFLVKGSVNVLAAPSGIGKTSLLMQMGICLANQKQFLEHGFQGAGPIKTGILSLEMQHNMLVSFYKNLLSNFTTEEQATALEHNMVSGLGYGSDLVKDKHFADFLLRQIDMSGVEVLAIDSLKRSGGAEEGQVVPYYDWISKELLAKRGLTVYLIHHTRKPPAERTDKEPKSLDDLYGDTYIGALADTVNFMWTPYKGANITLRSVKSRVTSFDAYDLMRNENHLYISLAGNECPVAPRIENAVSNREANPATSIY